MREVIVSLYRFVITAASSLHASYRASVTDLQAGSHGPGGSGAPSSTLRSTFPQRNGDKRTRDC